MMAATVAYQSVQQQSSHSLVEQHAALVKRIAYHLVNRLPPNVQVDDLQQAGMIGLLEAAKNFDATQGASFETYASIRIRGAMLDEIRRNDWAPRSVHRKTREAAAAIQEIENQTGRDAKDVDVAKALGLTLEEYHKLQSDTLAAKVFSIDQEDENGISRVESLEGEAIGPSANLTDEGFRQALIEVIGTLPEKEQLVMALYYDEELNQKEIGEILGVSESRVCQIHGKALLRIKSKMSDWT